MADNVIVFTNPQTAEAYEALTAYNQKVEVPVKEKGCNCKNYIGMLSDITPCAAKRYIAFGGNLIRAKEQSAVPAASGQGAEVKATLNDNDD